MDIFGIKALLIAALIFIPFEHLFHERPQKTLRKGLGVDIAARKTMRPIRPKPLIPIRILEVIFCPCRRRAFSLSFSY